MMKVKFLIIPLIFPLIVSCSGGKKGSTEIKDTNNVSAINSGSVDIAGQWYIENIFFNDSTYTRPAEVCPGSRQYVLFESDGSYSVMTNCNHCVGKYSLSGNVISFRDGAWTELACDNMATEEAMHKILPLLCTVDVENDSVMRINSDTDPYLILLRANEIK